MEGHIILAVHITNRMQKAGEVQKVFTEFGCNIKTRIGLHEVTENACKPSGVVILEIFGSEAEADQLAAKLGAIEGVETKKIVFKD